MQNVEIGVVWRIGVTQGHRQRHHLLECIWLPIRHLIETVRLLYRLRVTASYLSKVAYVNLLHLYLASPMGLTRSNFAEIFGVRKLESLGCHVVLLGWSHV